MNRSFNKGLLLAAAVSVLALVAPLGSAVADTTVNTTWNGAGTLSSNGNTTNSSSYVVNTGGAAIAGSMTYHNNGDNPYGYNVPSTSLDVNASAVAGGVDATTTRTGSASPYGLSGQLIYAQAVSSDGSAELVQHTSVNYAGLQDLGHYGVTGTSGGNTLQASGSAITLNYSVDTGVANNNAGISVTGSGSASLTQNYAGASANGLTLGVGGGDYQLAAFSAKGVGTMQTGALTTGSLGIVNTGGTVYGTAAHPGSVLTTVNYDTTGAAPGTSQTWNYGISGNSH